MKNVDVPTATSESAEDSEDCIRSVVSNAPKQTFNQVVRYEEEAYAWEVSKSHLLRIRSAQCYNRTAVEGEIVKVSML